MLKVPEFVCDWWLSDFTGKYVMFPAQVTARFPFTVAGGIGGGDVNSTNHTRSDNANLITVLQLSPRSCASHPTKTSLPIAISRLAIVRIRYLPEKIMRPLPPMAIAPSVQRFTAKDSAN